MLPVLPPVLAAERLTEGAVPEALPPPELALEVEPPSKPNSCAAGLAVLAAAELGELERDRRAARSFAFALARAAEAAWGLAGELATTSLEDAGSVTEKATDSSGGAVSV